MNVKSIAKGLLLLNVAALAVTAAVTWFMGIDTLSGLLDIAVCVALGMGALGALQFIGTTTGSDGSVEIAASAADRPSKLIDALRMDRDAGISAGAMLVMGGLSWLGLSWGLSEVLSHLFP